jgi:hypothetical protein
MNAQPTSAMTTGLKTIRSFPSAGIPIRLMTSDSAAMFSTSVHIAA